MLPMLARHVAHVHMHSEPPESESGTLSPRLLRAYIARARQHKPWVPEDMTRVVTSIYVEMRSQDAKAEKEGRPRTEHFTCARSLQALLRLAQANARLRL
ncbi:DNA replication licensing factor Mcm7, partial [Kipferlia bialata]|eukprot:g13672.t1